MIKKQIHNACLLLIISSVATLFSQQQPLVINNMTLCAETAEYHKRYDLIKNTVLANYRRPITVLDIDANCGYYSFSIARDYHNATCVMMDTSDQLLRLCQLNTKANGVVLLNTKATVSNLELLSECQHFDVVLGLNLLVSFPDNWQKAIDVLLTLGDNIILQATTVGQQDNTKAEKISDHLQERGGTPLADTQLFLFPLSKLYLHKAWWQAPNPLPLGDYFMESTQDSKIFHNFKTNKTYNWPRGIGLFTFLKLSGVFPSNKTVRNSLQQLKNIGHHALNTENLIIQGTSIVPINFYDEQTITKEQANNNLQNNITLFS